MWCVYTMEYYSAMRKNRILPFATTWMNLEDIMQNEINQTEEDKYCWLSLIWGIKKTKNNETHKTVSRMVVPRGCESESCSVVSNSLQPHGLYSPWNSPGQNTGVGSLSLLQGIFSIQGSNPGLQHCKQILYQPSYKRSPRILEWVAYTFSSRSYRPRNGTRVSCISGRFFTNWATREVPQGLWGGGNGEILIQGCKRLFIRWRISEDLMYSMVNIFIILYCILAKRLDLKCSHVRAHTHTQRRRIKE